MLTAEDLLAPLGLSPADWAVQLPQTQFRQRLLESWQIEEGARVLEIGCGQGDMSLVLADAVGIEGHVTATDSAPDNFGAPSTFAEAAARISRTPAGRAITFAFDTDPLDPATRLPFDRYDCAVLAHCSWYFETPDRLRRTLARIAEWTDRLCLSEWDLQAARPSQLPHMLSVMFQATMASASAGNIWNIQSLLTRAQIQKIVQEAGWTIENNASVESRDLQDGRWEVGNCLAQFAVDAPGGNDDGLDWGALSKLTSDAGIESLSSFTLTCRR